MPTPLGHSITGLAIYSLFTKKRCTIDYASLLLIVVMVNLPDLDFITWGHSGIEISGRHHHGMSHSLGFALGMGLLIYLWSWWCKRSNGVRRGVLVFVAYSTHLLFDLFSIDGYAANGIGLPILWPLSERYYMIPLLPPVDRTHLFTFSSFTALLVELVVCGLFWWGALRLRKR